MWEVKNVQEILLDTYTIALLYSLVIKTNKQKEGCKHKRDNVIVKGTAD